MLARFFMLACLFSVILGAQPAAEAMKLAAAGDFAGAEQLLAKAVSDAPADPELRYRLGVILLRQKKFADAARHLESAANLSPAVAPVWLALAHARLENGQIPSSREAASQARKIASADPNILRALGAFHRQLAVALRSSKDPAGAVDAWQEAITLAPDQASWYAELANLFLDHRTPEPAVAVLTSATARFPDNPELFRLLGLACYSAGQTQQAIDAFLRVMDLAPESEENYSSIETLLGDAGGKLPAIVERLRKFIAAQPSSPVGHYLLALALAVEGTDASAVESLLRKAIAAEPKFWPAHYELHKPLLGASQIREAAQSLEHAVKLNPEYAPARYALARVYGLLGDRVRAAEQRRAHHDLLTRARQAAAERQAAMPVLPYKLRMP